MKVAINLNTKTIVDLLPDNATSDNGFLKSNGYVMLDIENAVSSYIEDNEGVKPVFRALTDAELTPFMLVDINSNYENSIRSIASNIPLSEILTFPIQDREAREWLKDNTTETPFIDALVRDREVTKEYLVGKIIEKSNQYSSIVGGLTGLRQKQEKLIKGEN